MEEGYDQARFRNRIIDHIEESACKHAQWNESVRRVREHLNKWGVINGRDGFTIRDDPPYVTVGLENADYRPPRGLWETLFGTLEPRRYVIDLLWADGHVQKIWQGAYRGYWWNVESRADLIRLLKHWAGD
jgi:hypothetical protein